MVKIKKINLSAIIIALLPGNWLRVALNRFRHNYRIGRGVKIGWATILDAKEVTINDGARLGTLCIIKSVGRLVLGYQAVISPNNRFFDASHVEIGEGTRFGGDNRIQGSSWLSNFAPGRTSGGFKIGDNSIVTSSHLFDVTNGITIGSQSTIGGRNSSFWTHGVSLRRGIGISIGNRCYLGSDVKVASGVNVPDNVLVSLGSILTNSINEPDCIVSGIPAKIIKKDPDWRK